MRKSKLTKLLAVFLVFIFVFSMLPIALYAAETNAASFRRTIEDVKEILNTISYDEYLAKYADISNGSNTYTIDATQYVAEETTADVSIETYDGKRALYIGETGKATWPVSVSATGMYALEIEYYPVEGKATSIERTLYVDGRVPFSESRSLSMTKVWVDVYEGEFGEFIKDTLGNDIRPTKKEAPEWRTYTAIDSTGFYTDPFTYYFSSGDHTLSLEAVREPIAISEIRIKPIEILPTYEEYIADAQSKGAKETSVEPIKVNAENPNATSESVIYPIYDRTSAITDPQDAYLIKLNTIGKDKWKTVGQWVRYEVEVPEAGLYYIIPRFKQSLLSGMFTSRSVRINGEIPFDEAKYCQFSYNDSWQTKPLNNGETEFLFYLEAGTNTIEFEAVLGNLAVILNEVTDIVDVLNSSYLDMLKITGASPDQYRDYNFARLVPHAIINMAESSERLYDIAEELYLITGQRGEHVSTLNKVADLLEKMASDEDEVAKNMANLKSYLGTLGTWLYSSREQSIEFDYFMIQPASAEMPRATANFFQAAWFEVKSFVLSFFADYNTMGTTIESTDGEKVENVVMWYTEGRDQAQILRQMIDYEFTPNSGVPVTLKLVAAGSLLPSILAGVGPDVTFLSSSDTINYAIRSAVIPVDTFDTFDEVISRFPDVATIPLTLYEDNNVETVYGIPSTMSFSMMFYRMDVFANLGIEIPETWTDMYSILPVLQNNKMEIAFPNKLGGTNFTIYQMGGELYAERGKRINLDSNIGLTAFSTLTDLFTKYKFPLTYDFPTRFRTGEMPLGIVDYGTYNTLIVYASEIRDLWEMVPVLGWEHDDGTVNNSTPAGVSAIVMPRGAQQTENGWKLIDWFTSANAQARYANELVAVLGPAGKYQTANVEALAELPWTAAEYRALEAQMQNLAAIPEHPGGYIITRYVDFAFMNVYNNNADPVDSMLMYITEINKEITRKRDEFGMESIPISYSTNFVEAAD